MGRVAKDRPAAVTQLPAPAPLVPAPVEPPRTAATGTFSVGMPVRDVLRCSTLRGAEVLAGDSGLDRVVERLNVMEVPDILPWVKPRELLLTTGYPLRDTPEMLAGLVEDLAGRGLAALGVKLGRYLDELPPQMLEVADRLGFPIIRLPDGVGFDDILNQVLTDVLNRQAGALARSESAHRALVSVVLAGGGLQELADELLRLVGGTVLVTTPDGRPMATAGPGPDVATARRWFDATGRFRTEAAGSGVHASSPADPGLGSLAVVPVVAGTLDHGRIVVLDTDCRLGEHEVHVLERAATVAALAITKELAVSAVEDRYRGDFARDLLLGQAGTPEQAVAHARSLGWRLDRPVVVVVAALDPEEGAPAVGPLGRRPVQERLAAAWATVVRSRDASAPVVGRFQEVVALLGVPEDGDVGRLVRDLVRQVSGDGGGGRQSFATGVGRVAASISDVPASYEQARTAVTVGRQLGGRGSVAHFDELGVFRLLSLLPDSAELRSFLEETLGELAGDDPEAEDLRGTLQSLLDTNLNVAETSRRLHFHYNTLRYRIGKLERILGPFTTDPHLRLELALALQVRRMRGI